ncbi:MAG TPA: cyclohexanecarboxylate-CoA ligase, partial [Mycobacterium sp.]|nr:cyclohexanecarboxylate-CoA ligase [Mycobacterium sp.]
MSNGRKAVGGRSIRWSDERAAQAYDAGLWIRGTLADALRLAARDTPERVVLVDGDVELDCRELYRRSAALAAA